MAVQTDKSIQPAKLMNKKRGLIYALKKYHPLYIMLIPALIYLLCFKLMPLLGSVIAFLDYNIYQEIWESKWVGFKWFIQFFSYDQFRRLLTNNIIISLLQIVFSFPAPIILACLLNEVKNYKFKRTIQTIVYLPHFLSWAIIYGIFYTLFSTQVGLVNMLVKSAGMEPIRFLDNPSFFRPLLVISGIWKEMGWGAIIFLAAIAGINVELYESATIDGAGRWKRFVHITLPGIIPAVITMLLLKIGFILDVGFEQIYTFLTPMTKSVGDVLDTFMFTHGVQQGQYSISTAVGLFKSVVGLLFMIIANSTSKALTGEGLY